MIEKQNTLFTNFKFYHFLILIFFLSYLLILNSNYAQNKRGKEKLIKEKAKLFNEIISERKLEEEEIIPIKKSDQVCSRGSANLIKYFQTGDLGLIELDDKPIKCEDKDKDYFKALIKIMKNYIGKDKDKENKNNNESNGEIRNLESITDMKDELNTYGKHLLPIFIFSVVAILCIPGWIVCCFCTCCNCCCCCCCKKPGCKVPCFIFTYIFYGLSVAICIYGLTQSNKIFVGIADTECSLLKFFDQVLDGETKQETVKWPGIKGINSTLDNLKNEIDGMKIGTLNNLEEKISLIDSEKDTFIGKMKNSGNKFFDEENYKTDLAKSFSYSSSEIDLSSQKYVLDIIKMFGKYEESEEKFLPEKSTLDLWEKEFSVISSKSDEYLQTAYNSFEDILNNNVDELLKNLNNGKEKLNKINEKFDSFKIEIEDYILDYSKKVDDYGKLAFKFVFSILGLINIALGVLVLLICFCSGKLCTNCCCFRCLCKTMTHLLWNILALLMIIIFIIGCIFSLLGIVGSDAMSVISFIVSEDNKDNIVLDKLGDSKSYLDRCINGDGDIVKELGIENKIESFNNINHVENEIINAKQNFTSLRDNPLIYSKYYELFQKKIDLIDTSLSLYPIDTNDFNHISNILNFEIILLKLNTTIQNIASVEHKNESWSVNGDESIICSKDTPNSEFYTNPTIFNLKQCPPLYRAWISASSEEKIKAPADIITQTIEFLKIANSNQEYSYKKVINDLKTDYQSFLNNYIDALDLFNSTINKITNNIRKYTGNENGLFDFIRCNFIRTNLKIILKYLKYVFGTDIYTIGICLLVVGCSLILSISSTILLLVVINVSIDDNKKKLELKNKKLVS